MLIRMLLLLILMTGCAYAEVERVIETITTQDSLGNVYTNMQAGSTNTYFTRSFSVKNQNFGTSVGAMYKATSGNGGTINITVTPQMSFQRPATEQTVDATYIDWKITGTSNLTTPVPGWASATLDSVLMPFGRFKIVGSGSNDTATTVQIKVGK